MFCRRCFYFAHGSNHICGMLMLFKERLKFEMKSVFTDENGRYILLHTEYTLRNLYAPSKVQQRFFLEELQQNFDHTISHTNQGVVLGDDFNVISVPDLDCSDGSPTVTEYPSKLKAIC